MLCADCVLCHRISQWGPSAAVASGESTLESAGDLNAVLPDTIVREIASVSLRDLLRFLYFGNSRAAHNFRYGLLAFDVATIVFVIATSYLPRTSTLELFDLLFGVLILSDFSARLYASSSPGADFKDPATWCDVAAMFSFLAPLVGEGFAFLRVLRTLRFLHAYQMVSRLRADSPFFRRNEEVIIAVLNVAVFLFVMTGVVYETQHWHNPAIGNYINALCFTVTTLTTTGYGDITLSGPTGHLIAITIMIFGVTLFLRLLQALIRPHKVRHHAPLAVCNGTISMRFTARPVGCC
jgi:voltage-gated potassium channel